MKSLLFTTYFVGIIFILNLNSSYPLTSKNMLSPLSIMEGLIDEQAYYQKLVKECEEGSELNSKKKKKGIITIVGSPYRNSDILIHKYREKGYKAKTVFELKAESFSMFSQKVFSDSIIATHGLCTCIGIGVKAKKKGHKFFGIAHFAKDYGSVLLGDITAIQKLLLKNGFDRNSIEYFIDYYVPFYCESRDQKRIKLIEAEIRNKFVKVQFVRRYHSNPRNIYLNMDTEEIIEIRDVLRTKKYKKFFWQDNRKIQIAQKLFINQLLKASV
ncbi:hypothetical protein ACFLQ1_01745 [Candidatus Auribacterota bacterium]